MSYNHDSKKRKEPSAYDGADGAHSEGAVQESAAKRAKVSESTDSSTWHGVQTYGDAQYADPNAAAQNYDWAAYYAAQGYDYSQYYSSPEYYAYYYGQQGASGYPDPSQQQQQQPHAVAPTASAPPPGSIMGSMPADLKKKSLRIAAGQVWKDPTLADWPDDDYRVFVGNLGPEVTDADLNRAFSKYKSLLRVRVIMEAGPRGKSRGYGFLSFGDPHDFLAAMKEMNGKYVGSRPVKLTKSDWKDRSLVHKKGSKKQQKGQTATQPAAK